MIIFYTCDLHFLQILNQVMQTINQIMGKK
jgi:hypothetical protein